MMDAMHTIEYDRGCYGQLVNELAVELGVRNQRLKDRWQVLGKQQERLEKLLGHAFVESRYYKQLAIKKSLSGAHALAAYSQLPLMNRASYIANLDLIRNSVDGICFRDTTSGTSGMPLEVFRDSRSIFLESTRFFDTLNYYLGESIARPTLIVYVSHYSTSSEHRYYDPVLKALTVKVRCDLEPLVERLARLGLNLSSQRYVLTGTVSSLNYLAISQASQAMRPKPVLILPSGEFLASATRKYLENFFQARACELYTLRECGTIAFQCNQGGGLHIHADSFVLEVVNKSGEVVSDGEVGECIVSDLNNFHVPLLRYATGDRASISWANCACGLALPILQELRGRSPTFFATHDGKCLVDTADFAKRLECLPIFWYRVEQMIEGTVNVEYAAGVEVFPEDKLKGLCADLQRSLGSPTDVVITRISVEQASQRGKTGGFIALAEQ